ncbi:MAG TPA: efflux RND transporter periplasmic adaptor subunit [Burkholderiales bacterium]|nr:efflux RND transporter periplasmic adaptor subunit [Burkholderiales bacterium]
MKRRTIAVALVVIGVTVAAGYGAYWFGMSRGMQIAGGHSAAGGASSAAQQAGDIDPATGKKILYWHDPMVPGQKFDKPGKSPFMDMQLVPVYEDSGGSAGGVSVDPRMQQSLGVRTAEVIKGAVEPVVEAVGNVAYNERDVALVQARSNGFVEKLYVRAQLDPVRKGQPLAELYVPDWVAAQEEYLSARRLAGTRMESIIEGARQRMRLAGMNEAQIRQVESTGKVQARLVTYAPIDGVVAELSAREGMTVMSGAPLFRINGLRTVWVNAEVRENEAAQVKVGNEVEARAAALPGKVFKGKVSAILPEVNAATRTLKARVELANPGGELKPGMFAIVNFTPAVRKEILVVPSEAVIQTGRRSVVIVAQVDGKFAPVEVQTGMEANGQTEIQKGLEAGQKVVASGQFLIDSEASLRASETRMGDQGSATPEQKPAAAAEAHKGTGKVLSVDAASGRVELEHDAIPSLQWPAMSMGFQAEDKSQLAAIKPGDRVAFELNPKPNKDGDFTLRSIRRGGGK